MGTYILHRVGTDDIHRLRRVRVDGLGCMCFSPAVRVSKVEGNEAED